MEFAGRVWRLADLLELGEAEEADREIDTYMVLARESGHPRFLAYGYMLQAMRALLRGDFEEAERSAWDALLRGRQMEDSNIFLCYHVQMATLRSLQGRPEEMNESLGIVVERVSEEAGKLLWATYQCWAGGTDQAHLSLSAVRWVSGGGPPPAFRLMALAALAFPAAATGKPPELEQVYQLLLPYAGRNVLAGRDVVVCLGPVARSLGILAASLSRFDEAAGHFEDALEANVRLRARPHLAYTQYEYSAMLLRRGRAEDAPRAAALLAQAFDTAKQLGMGHLLEVIQALNASPEEPLTTTGVANSQDSTLPALEEAGTFRLEGEYWTIAFQGKAVRMRDTKGLRYLQRLLREPGREFHVLDLAVGEGRSRSRGEARKPQDEPVGFRGDAGEILDPQAKAAYRARAAELEEEFEQAEAQGDTERGSRARTEIEFLNHELTSALGLGGRDRRAASAAERARFSVSKSLRSAVKRIGQAHPDLGDHLSATLKTGYFCAYTPDPRLPLSWQT
jgi:tetratricopeptide (TPR) repeat protein